MGVGQREKATQKRVIKLFAQELGYTYLGDFTERKNSNIETELLTKFLTRKGYSPVLISRALKELQDAAGTIVCRRHFRMVTALLYSGEFPVRWRQSSRQTRLRALRLPDCFLWFVFSTF